MTKISALPAGTAAVGTEKIAVVQNGVTAYLTLDQVLQLGIPVFNVARYATPQAAVNACLAAHGGVVYFPAGDFNLGTGLVINDNRFPIRLTGIGNAYSSGADTASNLFYVGTGTAISARSCNSLEIDHLNIFCTGVAPSKIIDSSTSATGTGSGAVHIHHCTLSSPVSSATAIGVDLHNTQGAVVEHNLIGVIGGIGIRGVPTGGLWAVKATIAKNTFTGGTAVCINGPGQVWSVENNVAQAPGAFITPGPAGTCDVLTVKGNWIGDYFGATATLIRSNAGSLVSEGNTYSIGTVGTCILQDNSTGSVTSTGDRLEAAVGIAIGTGNYLEINAPNPVNLPTTLYTGTPANIQPVAVHGGPTTTTGTASFGKSGLITGLQEFWNLSAGNHRVLVSPQEGLIGVCTVNWPAYSTILIGKDSVDFLTNKTFDTAGAGNVFKINGLAATINTGTGAVVRATSPALTTPTGIVKGDVGLGNVANVDTTNASNISSGTLANGRSAATNLAAGNVNGGVTGTLPVANGGTGDTGTSWTAYTPTISSGSGTITTSSATGRYKVSGKTVFVEANITVTTAGTGGGNLAASLPFTSAAFIFTGSAINFSNGKSGSCFSVGTVAFGATDATGTTFIASGANVIMTMTYETP